MTRRVAFSKAIAAGAVGALVWEGVNRVLLSFGVPSLDIIYILGTLVTERPWAWWLAGTVLHTGVGALWAVFYAYFVWSELRLPPLVQGMVFSVGPAVLAGLIMLPQLALMHPLILDGRIPAPGIFGRNYGIPGTTSVVLGHMIYGLVMGSLYTHPVGYPVRRRAAA